MSGGRKVGSILDGMIDEVDAQLREDVMKA